MRWIAVLISILSVSTTAFASLELGVNYAYKKSSFDANNNQESQSTTGSISFYFWERVALEGSYTNSLFVKKEKQPEFAGAFQRTTTQNTDVYGLDLIFVLSDRKAMFQPYLKGGAAHVKVKQMVQDDNNNPWEINYSGVSPSYGVGFKLFLTQAFAFRCSYDAIETPTTDNTKVTELNGRVGVSWIF